MMPEQWVSPCGNQCTNKYSALTQIPWRVFCKKGCSSEEETWEECLEYCNLMCYKDPVLKDQQWSAYIDRSPGAASYSAECWVVGFTSFEENQNFECFHACVSGCGYKFDVKKEKVDEVTPNGRPKPAPVEKPRPQPEEPIDMSEDILSTSA